MESNIRNNDEVKSGKLSDPEYFRKYYIKNGSTIKKRQKDYYYKKNLNIPLKYVEIYKKHKKILKWLPIIDSIDKEAIEFFTKYYKEKDKEKKNEKDKEK